MFIGVGNIYALREFDAAITSLANWAWGILVGGAPFVPVARKCLDSIGLAL
jgi:hypothetical protein